ncbi:MAG TPA: DinB family protein [Puia sp.]|nr:DinB family protein [Puia sp.]
MVTRLQHQHESIREIIGDLPDTTLRLEVIPGKWSVHSNIAHLAAYQPVFIDRLKRMSREPAPAFGRYVAENDALFPAFLDRTTASLLEQITADRALITTTLETAGEAFLTRSGTHPRYGLLTVKDWTEFFLLHEAHHLYTIYALIHSTESNP